MPILGLPRDFFPSILPSNTRFSKLSPRTTCLIQSFFLLIIVFIKHLSSPTKLSIFSFVLLNATFAIQILAFTSSMHDPFSVIITPRYLNVLTCSTLWPSMVRLTALPSSRDTTITFVFLFHMVPLCSFIQSIHHFLQCLFCTGNHSLIIRKSHILKKFATHSHSFLNILHCF